MTTEALPSAPIASALSPRDLCGFATSFLLDVVRGDDALFPYSTTVREGAYVNDFEHPAAIRYTINSLLGLKAAASREPRKAVPAEVEQLVDSFVRHHWDDVRNPGDLGLALVLLTAEGSTGPHAEEALRGVRAAMRAPALGRLTMQDVSWMLWGACAAAHGGADGAHALAVELGDLVLARFVDPGSRFPRHDLSRYRRDVVSFGALAYFLRAMFELARLTGDPRAMRAFEDGVATTVALQGDLGEWPWLISVRRRIPLDCYPVFAVHQDSMSMLFLLPALDAGLPVARAIEKSWAWVLGHNELGTPMTRDDPFVAYRSIERAEQFPRARRYLRSVPRSFTGSAGRTAGGRGVRINPECRSYHLGWVLYVWSGREQLPWMSGST